MPTLDLIGRLLTLPDDAYRYGSGELQIKVIGFDRRWDEFVGPVRWVAVIGTELGWSGEPVGRRMVWVREAALLAAVK